MTNEREEPRPQTPEPTEPTEVPPKSAPRARRGRPPRTISKETRAEIVRLHEKYGSRRIPQRLSNPLSRKIIRRVLREEGRLADDAGRPPTLLAAFEDVIASKVEQGLTTTRILRELRTIGYSGQRTILADYVRDLRAKNAPKKDRAKRRFETPLGKESQIDWSMYEVVIAGRPQRVHAFGCVLCASRKHFLGFFRDERQSTLLEALARAFEYFGGCTLQVVLDNMSTAILGRVAKHVPIWHPRFLAFARHFGFTPIPCAVADPDRKGKKEKLFQLVENDFLRGSEFESWEDLERRAKIWLDETPGVANLRVHGTTRRVPNEVWREEAPLLIKLPEDRFPVHEDAVRVVDHDATISVQGTRYSVPAALADRSVAVRLYADHFEVLDAHGKISFSRRYVGAQDKGKLIIDPTHYANVGGRAPKRDAGRLDEAFVARFPDLEPMVTGLKLRMKGLAHIHIRALLRLVDRFGESDFRAAVRRAQEHRNYSARAVEAILLRTAVEREPDVTPMLGGVGAAALGDIDGGTLDAYAHLDDIDPASDRKDGK